MTTQLSGIPYIEAPFDKDQRPLEPDQTDRVAEWLTDEGITDLLVMSHGWNNDIEEARDLYAALADSIALEIGAGSGGGLPGVSLGILGVLWPSKKFADEDLIPGAAASAAGDLQEEVLHAQLEDLRGFFDADGADLGIATLETLVGDLETDPEARRRFFTTARSLIGDPQDLDPDDRREIPKDFFAASDEDEIDELVSELEKPDPPGVSTTTTSSGAAGFSFSGFKAGFRRLLNYLTYYQMKKRGRKTGVRALAPMLESLAATHPNLRLHLVGHSFGGLLVTSAAWGGDGAGAAIPVSSMSLLQAAFSHNGFAEDFHGSEDGRYRRVLTDPRVSGPILVTHTRNDKAVGLAYALASRFARQDAAALGIGGADDRFGGIGANGAQHTPERVLGDLEGPGTVYDFAGGKLYNLLADDFVTNHSDVHGRAVANAIVNAVASTTA